jgi:hypothetical protein
MRMRKTKYPGVWRLPSGGYHVRTSAIDPRSGRLLTRKRNLPKASMADAIQEVARLREIAKAGGTVRDPKKPTVSSGAKPSVTRRRRRYDGPLQASAFARDKVVDLGSALVTADLDDRGPVLPRDGDS